MEKQKQKQKQKLRKANRAYLKRVFRIKTFFYPLLIFLEKLGLLRAFERILTGAVRLFGINKSVRYFFKYRYFGQWFSGNFSGNETAKAEIIFPMMAGVNSNLTMLNLLFAKYFRDYENISSVFYICDSTLSICTKDGLLKSRDRYPWFCHECWNGYKYIEAETGIPILKMSSYVHAALGRMQEQEKAIELIGSLEECFNYCYEGLEIGLYARKSVLRYFLTGSLKETPEIIEVYKKFLIAATKYYLSFNKMLDSRPEAKYVIMNNGSLVFEAIARELCKGRDIDYMTYETYIGNNTLIYKKNGAVMDFDWEAEYYEFLKNFKLTTEIRGRVSGFFNDLRQGKEMYAVLNKEHTTERMESVNRYACLFTNLNYDTAVIDKNFLFKNMEEWIMKVIDFWKTTASDITLIIRIHPGEIKLVTASKEFLGNRIRKACGDSSRIIVFDADDKVNSYELIKNMDFGLIYSSTIGLEIAWNDKTCIVAGLPWFRNKPFIVYPKTEDDYFGILRAIINSKYDFVPDKEELLRITWFVYFNRIKRFKGLKVYTPTEEMATNFENSDEMISSNINIFNEFSNELI